jgi:heme exporter protein CcmD
MSFDIENAKAGYVIAAYAVAAAGLLGLLIASWRAARRRRSEWDALEARRGRKAP